MSVWSQLKKAGEEAKREAESLRKAVFEKGEIPSGKKRTEKLFIEADGVWVRRRDKKRRSVELKLVVAYEEKKEGRLKERCQVSGIKDGEGIWEEAASRFCSKWDINEIKKTRIGGDGSPWVKAGISMFPFATYHLDRFHLRKRLVEALSFGEGHFQAVCEAISKLDKRGMVSALDKAISLQRGARRKRMRELKSYLLQNWEGISSLPEEERLGAIEGQVRHTITRRMKGIGGSWSEAGADRMARLLAARTNKELQKYVRAKDMPHLELLRKVVGTSAIDDSHLKEDPEDWLRAEMPALRGPFSGLPWIKYVLRELSSVRFSA